MNYGIRSYSSVHKVRNCFPTLFKPRVVLPRIAFGVPDRSVYQDTFGNAGDLNGTYSYSYGVNSYTFDYNQGNAFDAIDITGHIVLHEIGNGVNDALLNKVILEAMPDSSWVSYDYSTFVDPYLYINMRSSAWVDGQGENIIDLIALNMAVRGGLNPFCSTLQTPNVEGTGDRVTFDGDDRYVGGIPPMPANAQGKPVESLILLAPMNTKFRRMLLTLRSKKIAVLRSITVVMSEYTRKGYG